MKGNTHSDTLKSGAGETLGCRFDSCTVHHNIRALRKLLDTLAPNRSLGRSRMVANRNECQLSLSALLLGSFYDQPGKGWRNWQRRQT